MADEDKTPGSDDAGGGETPPFMDFFADVPGVGDYVKDAYQPYQKQQNRVGADAEAKPPSNEGFADKIDRTIDPWDPGTGEDLTPTPPPPSTTDKEYFDKAKEYYDQLDLKTIPHLDTYEKLATQYSELVQERSSYELERGKREQPQAKIEREQAEAKIEYLRDWAEDDTSFYNQMWPGLAGAYEDAADKLEAEMERPPLDPSTLGKVYKDGVTPDPDVAAELRNNVDYDTNEKDYDTYEKLEAKYKEALLERDQEFTENYQSRQREAVEEAVEEVGEGLKDIGLKDIPVVGDVQGSARDVGPMERLRNLGGMTEEDDQGSARDGGVVDHLRKIGGMTNEDEALPVDKPGASSAAEQVVEPPGSEAAPIVKGEEASSRLIGGEALPTDALRDETLSGEGEGGGAPEATGAPAGATAAAPATTADGAEIEMPPDAVEQAGAAVAAVGQAGVAIGAEAVGEAGGPGETIEQISKAILVDPPGAAGDVVEHMDDPATNAVLEDGVVEPPPFMEDTLEGGGLGGDDVGGNEDVVEHMDDPVF